MKIMTVIAAALLVSVLAACGAGMGGMGMGGCGMGHSGHGDSSHEAHQQSSEHSTAPADADFDAVKVRAALEAYQAIVAALASDRVDGVENRARIIVDNGPTATIRESASRLSQAAAKGDLAGTRARFKEMTEPMVAYVESNRDAIEEALEGMPVPGKAYCPMADARWLQGGDEITNPFFGSSMLRCGEFQDWAANP